MMYYVQAGPCRVKGELQFFSQKKLMELYKVDPSSCVTSSRSLIPGLRYIVLTPDSSEAYKLPEPKRFVRKDPTSPFHSLIWAPL